MAIEDDFQLVGEAPDATTAAALADDTDPSVALVDVLLPDVATGLALVRLLGRRSNCAVVAMSVDSGAGRAALTAGATAFVEKGTDIDGVLSVIRRAAPPSSH